MHAHALSRLLLHTLCPLLRVFAQLPSSCFVADYYLLVLAVLTAPAQFSSDLLRDVYQAWQGPALDALAAWLGEDATRLEPRLRQRDAVLRFVALFASYSQNADSEALASLLDPFLRIMKRSRKITVWVSVHPASLLLLGLCWVVARVTADKDDVYLAERSFREIYGSHMLPTHLRCACS